MRKTLLSLFLVLVICGAGSLGFLVAWQTRAPLMKEIGEHKASLVEFEEKQTVAQNEIADLNKQIERNNQGFETEIQALTNAQNQQMAVLSDGHRKQVDALRADLGAQISELVLKNADLTISAEAKIDEMLQLKTATDEAIANKETELASLKEEQTASLESKIKDAIDAANAQFTTTQEENTYLYGELDRYAQTANEMLKRLGEDVGGLDILLSPKFKADYAEFLDEINLKSD